MSILAKVINGFFTILGKGNIYPRVNLVAEGKPTILGMVDNPEKEFDAANKKYVDTAIANIPVTPPLQITQTPPADITADGYVQLTVNGVTIQLFGKIIP